MRKGSYRSYATALGIPLDRVSVELTGTIDLKGFFVVDDAVRPGHQGIGCAAPAVRRKGRELQKLYEIVNAHCPTRCRRSPNGRSSAPLPSPPNGPSPGQSLACGHRSP